MTYQLILSFILAYFIGGIPFSVWIGKIFYGKDIREYGSGNAGATNTFRVLGTQAGIIVLFLDIAKGMIAVSLAYYLGTVRIESDTFLYYQIGLGIVAGLGHIFPIYLGFKGGKGVATFLGVGLAIFPVAALICIGTFLLIFLITRYVSLGSLLASLVFPFIVIFYYHFQQWPIVCFSILIPVIIFYTHRQNIQRLINGTENKINFSRKKNES